MDGAVKQLEQNVDLIRIGLSQFEGVKSVNPLLGTFDLLYLQEVSLRWRLANCPVKNTRNL